MVTSSPETEIFDTTPRPVPVPAGKKADLVLEGGGVKGIGLVGAVLTLHEQGYVFPRAAGTSAGAITAALVAALQAAGKPLALLEGYVNSVDYPKFQAEGWLQRTLGPVGDAGELLLHMGMHSADYLVEWLGGILEEIGVTTFEQLRMDDPGSSLPEAFRYSLIVHTADITRRKVVRLPWDYGNYGLDPGRQRIVDAVRASMSIPFFFEPVRLHAPAATFDGVSYSKGSVIWVDGGLLSNFPVEVFDRSDGQPQRWPTIGIKLSARDTTVPARCERRHDPPGDRLSPDLAQQRGPLLPHTRQGGPDDLHRFDRYHRHRLRYHRRATRDPVHERATVRITMARATRDSPNRCCVTTHAAGGCRVSRGGQE